MKTATPILLFALLLTSQSALAAAAPSIPTKAAPRGVKTLRKSAFQSAIRALPANAQCSNFDLAQ
jgi:hypothetical protein